VRVTGFLAFAAGLALLCASPAAAQVVAPPFDQAYSVHNLGAPPGVPTQFGGLTLKAGTTDRLLIGGAANAAAGALYEIGVVRDGAGHITGFDGTATRYADAAYNDGGITYGPNGVLFLARWPSNQLGQTKPGSTTTDRVIEMSAFNVASSLAALQFVPAGQPGAGSLKLSSYGGGQWYDAAVVPDGNGTFDITGVTPIAASTLPGGPEGFVYVAPGSPQFSGPSLLVSEYGADFVAAYDVDLNGDPIVSSRRVFLSQIVNPEGAFLDPVTGDYLFSTFGGSNQVVVVRGFAQPPVSLAVRTTVTNDDGGTLAPQHFTVHVRDGGTDVAGSPQPGSASGAFYAVTEGRAYRVAVAAPLTYSISIGGACAGDGTVTARAGVQPVCTVTADDVAAPPPPVQPQGTQPTQQQELPAPEAGEEVNAVPKSGTVRVRVRGSRRFVELEEGQQIPVGSVVDTTKGRVTIEAAGDQAADFYDGVFRLSQGKGARPLTTLTLVDAMSCPRGRNASAAAKKKKKRRLWGNGRGRFRTSGKHSAATVVGTRWLVEDRCTSTLTKVTRGKVRVRDFAKRKNVTVRAGKQYVARAKADRSTG
jgi:hypothetical protein